MAKQLIRLTEEDLNKIVENSVRRAMMNEYGLKDFGKDALKFGAAATIGTAAMATDNPLSRGIDRQFADQEEMGRASQVDRDEMERNNYLDGLKRDGVNTKTISWNDANQFEGKVSKAITESIDNFVNNLIKKSEE